MGMQHGREGGGGGRGGFMEMGKREATHKSHKNLGFGGKAEMKGKAGFIKSVCLRRISGQVRGARLSGGQCLQNLGKNSRNYGFNSGNYEFNSGNYRFNSRKCLFFCEERRVWDVEKPLCMSRSVATSTDTRSSSQKNSSL